METTLWEWLQFMRLVPRQHGVQVFNFAIFRLPEMLAEEC